MQRIEPVIKDYAWGSRDALARLAGQPHPTDEPEAELWVGAHEAGPSLLAGEAPCCGLDEHIAADREHHLGARARDSFGDRLPFLLKILAAEKALSIQAHPDAERAASAPEGTYGDSWAKPEAWIPLVESEAFAGSLPFDEMRARFAALDVARAERLLDAASRETRPSHAFLTAILRATPDEQRALVRDVVGALESILDVHPDRPASAEAERGGQGSAGERTVGHRPALDDQAVERHALRTVLDVHAQFPGDIGVVVLLTMRHHVMRPGSSYFIAAGVLHSFVRGTTVEILANSDNVVRGGLTPKRIDVAELLTIVDVDADVRGEEPTRDAEAGEILRYASHVPHFALWEMRPGREPISVPAHGEPGLLMALDAPVTLECAGERLELGRLECAWWPAGDPPATVTGENGSRLFVATLND